jgi:hypothetical protein
MTLRRRLLVLTSGVAVAFAIAAGWVVRLALRPAPEYTPGGEVAGLTATLARDIPEDHPRITFVDVTEAAGITFQHFPAVRTSQLTEDMGSGAAWGDFDGDGWPDLAIANLPAPFSPDGPRPPGALVLYRNGGEGSFTDVTAASGIAADGWGMGVEWADVDNDGWLDLLLTTYGALALYRNRGDGTFEDVTAAAGLDGFDAFWAGLGFADYDRDGDLDLYVTGYVEYTTDLVGATSQHYDVEEPASINPSSFAPVPNLLLRNDGRGRFTDVAVRAGVSDPNGRSLEVAWADFDDDGLLDIYVANDVSDNRLYRNLGTGTFEDISHVARVADYRGAMGIAVGDWENDEDLDLIVTHWIAQENALYSNRLSQLREQQDNAPLQFMDEADRFGLGQIALDFVGWGTSLFDYDNDGWLDLLIVNGSTFQNRQHPTRLISMRDLLFWNAGPERGFFSVGTVSGEYFTRENVGRGSALADYDRDGDVDIFVVSHGGPPTLLENLGETVGSWLQIELRGERSNHFGVGARLRVVSGDHRQIREVGAQSSYLSQNELAEHFGLGGAEQADSVVVHWPSGLTQVLLDVPAGQRLVVRESADRP